MAGRELDAEGKLIGGSEVNSRKGGMAVRLMAVRLLMDEREVGDGKGGE